MTSLDRRSEMLYRPDFLVKLGYHMALRPRNDDIIAIKSFEYFFSKLICLKWIALQNQCKKLII